MKDYPEDNGSTMSQVHNGAKILLDRPADVGTMTVRVNGLIFFPGELLQRRSGAYFIPERFFTRPCHQAHPQQGQDDEIFSLGWDVVRLEVHTRNITAKTVLF
jgi:hypothetical protein